MTGPPYLKTKLRAFRARALFVGFLTVVISLAAPAHQEDVRQPETEASGISMPVEAVTTAQALLAPRRPRDQRTSSPGQALLLPVVTYDVGAPTAWAVAAADLNGDGQPDLVVTTSDSVGVLLGNGDGTFRPMVSYSLVGGGAGVAVADVNADGKPDILVATAFASPNGDGAAQVLLGNGDGTFQPAVSYDSGGPFTYSIAVGDFNGDGKLDLVVADCSPDTGTSCGLFGILLGNGDGTFKPVTTYNSGGVGAWSLTVADVNGDKQADIVIANLCADSSCTGNGVVAVFLGNGDGTFKAPETYNSGGRTLVPVVADVNGDGKPDIVVANGNGKTGVAVLLGNGDGTFQTAVTYDVGDNAVWSLTVRDINGDGKPDVVLSDYVVPNGGGFGKGHVSVLLGNGDGTFRPVLTYDSGGVGSLGIAVADLNGDGLPDVLVADCAPIGGSCGVQNGLVGVLLNNTGIGNPTTTMLVSSLDPSFVGQAVTFTATVSSTSGTPPNGETVTFKNGSAVLGTAPLSGGAASLITSSFAAGIYTMTASYAGDANFAASTSPGLRQVVNSTTKSVTATTLASSLNPSIYGQNVTWTATVTTAGSVPPMGKVKFIWNGNSIGSVTLNSSGVATLTKLNLNADSYPLTAVYAGDANNLGSTSSVLSQVVTQATSAATLTSSPNPSTPGQAVTFTATITSPTVRPTGPVTFAVGKTVLGTAQLSGGKAKFTTSTLAVGSTKVTATYYGDSNIAKSSASVTQTVQ
jgi:hypothetical protein